MSKNIPMKIGAAVTHCAIKIQGMTRGERGGPFRLGSYDSAMNATAFLPDGIDLKRDFFSGGATCFLRERKK